MAVSDKLLPPRFEILRELGSGGTSVVYHARDKENEREVAVKILIKERLGDRFSREAERLAELSHPNLVGFYEVGKYQGRDFLVMEYLPGGDLGSHLRGKDTEELLKLFVEICAGLSYLHSQGVVHRDVKPANILLDARGRPKLTDLGSARQVDRQTRITKVGSILGTYAYLAPEQIQSRDAGPAADLYSLGVCLFEALTGRRPFMVKNEFQLMKAHLEEPPPSLHKFRPELPASLENLVASLLEKQPEARPTTAKVVGRLLERCISELQSQEKRQLVDSDPDLAIEQLSEAQRSVLLAVGYLGEKASFAEICGVSPFAEDLTDSLLESLLDAKLLTCPEQDSFALTFPRKLVLSRVTPRVQELFLRRLVASGQAPSSSGMTTAMLTTQSDLSSATSADPASGVTPTPDEAPVTTRHRSVGRRWTGALAAALLLAGVGAGGAWLQSGELLVTTVPEPATVLLDGKWQGSTPLRLDRLRPGARTVEVVLDGYLDEVHLVRLEPGRPAELHLALKESRGRIVFEQLPDDAELTVGGAVYDPRSLKEVAVPAGKTRVRVSKPGYRPFLKDVLVAAGEPVQLKVEMSPVEGLLEITSSPSGASLFFDGKPIGTTPYFFTTLPFGEHRLELRQPGYLDYVETVTVADEAPERLHVELTPLPSPSPSPALSSSPSPALSSSPLPSPGPSAELSPAPRPTTTASPGP